LTDLNQALKEAQVDIDELPPSLRNLLNVLLNKIEELSSENKALKEENQRLRDEVNRLNGEQGKPNVRAQTVNSDFSSEQERKAHNENHTPKSKAKNHKIKVDRKQRLSVDKTKLPTDAVFKRLYQFYCPGSFNQDRQR
jgi:DNA repair exonuclease SbcCD ATPase subunit